MTVFVQLDELRSTGAFFWNNGIPRSIYRSGVGQLWTARGLQKSPTLFDLFASFQNAKCLDRRDRIFGLHGLSKKCCRNAVRIDYSRSIVQVTEAMLLHHRRAHYSYKEEAALLLPVIRFYSTLGLAFQDSTYNGAKIWKEALASFEFPDLVSRSLIVYTSPPLNKCRLLVSIQPDDREIPRINVSTAWRYRNLQRRPRRRWNDKTVIKLIRTMQVFVLMKEDFFEMPIQSMKVFFDENGMMGLVPEDIQTGDMICHYEGNRVDQPNESLIIREVGGGFEVIVSRKPSDVVLHMRDFDRAYDKSVEPHEFDQIHSCHLDFVASESLRELQDSRQ